VIITRVAERSGYDALEYRVKLGADKLETEREKPLSGQCGFRNKFG